MNKIVNKKIAFSSFLKSIFLICLYIILLYTPLKNTELVRGFCEDTAFDILDSLFLRNQEISVKNAPHIIVFKVDSEYEKYKKDENNSYSVGYYFPRSNIAEMITAIDNLPKKKQPKALFIDYNFDYTSMPDGKTMHKSDKKLLEVLSKKRKYTIYLPLSVDYEKGKNICRDTYITKQGHFISNLNSSNFIKFMSVGVKISSDGIARRYVPYCKIKNDDKKILHIAFGLSGIKTYPKDRDNNIIVKNRIIYKNRKFNDVDKDDHETSYWKNVEYYSAKRLINKNKENLNLIIDTYTYNPKKSIFIIGSFSNQTEDKFKIAGTFNKNILYGTNIAVNTTMTLAYLKGFLKEISWYYILPGVFILFFIFDYFISLLLELFKTNSFAIESFVSFVIISGIFLFLSYLIFIYFHLWFNWFLPVLMTEFIDILEFVLTKIKRRVHV